jgi:hypothetical protein
MENNGLGNPSMALMNQNQLPLFIDKAVGISQRKTSSLVRQSNQEGMPNQLRESHKRFENLKHGAKENEKKTRVTRKKVCDDIKDS